MRCHSSLPQKKPSEMKAEEVIEFVSSIEDLNEREKVVKAFQKQRFLGEEILDWKRHEVSEELGISLRDAGRILLELRNHEKSFRPPPPEPKRIVVRYSEDLKRNETFESQQDLKEHLDFQGAGSLGNGDNEGVRKLSELKQGETCTLSFAQGSFRGQVNNQENVIQNQQQSFELEGILQPKS